MSAKGQDYSKIFRQKFLNHSYKKCIIERKPRDDGGKQKKWKKSVKISGKHPGKLELRCINLGKIGYEPLFHRLV